MFTDFRNFTGVGCQHGAGAAGANARPALHGLRCGYRILDNVERDCTYRRRLLFSASPGCASRERGKSDALLLNILMIRSRKYGPRDPRGRADVNREREKNRLAAWEMRIGLHTGPAMAGVVGRQKFAYDVWGDTVNLAARLEQCSEAGRINISEGVYKRVGPARRPPDGCGWVRAHDRRCLRPLRGSCALSARLLNSVSMSRHLPIDYATTGRLRRPGRSLISIRPSTAFSKELLRGR